MEKNDCFGVRLFPNYMETGIFVEVSEDLQKQIKQYLLQYTEAGGDADFRAPIWDEEYLLISLLFRKAQQTYSRFPVCPPGDRLADGYRPLPYIRLQTTMSNQMETDRYGEVIPKDKSLTANVRKERNVFVLEYDKAILYRTLEFLRRVFDDNTEMIIEAPAGSETLFEGLDLLPRSDALAQACSLIQTNGLEGLGREYLQYIESRPKDPVLPPPIVTVYNISDQAEGKKTAIPALYLYDSSRKCVSAQIRKPIYLTKGFQNWFYRRSTLTERLFYGVNTFIMAHEISHVACGHLNLPPECTDQKRIRVCAEANADDTAIRWFLTDVLCDTADGVPWSMTLFRTADEFREEICLRILSAYLALSWVYRDEDRTWSTQTLEAYLQNERFRHPIYQFRTFFVLNRAKTVLYNMADEAKQEKMRTIDGREIDSEMVQYIWRSALEMVESFEAHFDETYYDERTTEEKLQQTYHFENQSRPARAEKLSYLMPIYLDRAAKEAKAIQNTWPELKNNLQKCTPCFPLYDKIG